MNATRWIIHLDLDAFYCAVEEKRDPALKGVAFAVGGKPSERGVVASCSYAARKQGVRSAMPMGQALRACPGLLIVSGRYRDYAAHSEMVMARLREITPLVEQLSIDEAFLDVSGLAEPAEQIARDLQTRIRSELDLPCSLGVASNKLVAKIASDVGKSRFTGDGPPNALTIVAAGQEAEFLAPLPVRALWGIGPKTEERLHAIGIRTIGELATADSQTLVQHFGKHGGDMAARAQGIDDSPIITERAARSMSQEVTFSRDVSSGTQLRQTIQEQSGRVAEMLRRSELSASTIRIKVRWSDFTTLSRQMTGSRPTNDPAVIAAVAWKLFRRVWQPDRPVRLIGVGASGLTGGPRQLSLWDPVER